MNAGETAANAATNAATNAADGAATNARASANTGVGQTQTYQFDVNLDANQLYNAFTNNRGTTYTTDFYTFPLRPTYRRENRRNDNNNNNESV